MGTGLRFLLVVVVGGWGVEGGCRGKFTAEKCAGTSFAFLAHAALLVGLIVAASYAGTSVLFAVFLAGAMST